MKKLSKTPSLLSPEKLQTVGLIMVVVQVLMLFVIACSGGLRYPHFSGDRVLAFEDTLSLIGVFLPGVCGLALLVYAGLHIRSEKRDTVGTVIVRWVLRIMLLFWVVLVLFPVVWMLYSSLKTPTEFISDPWGLPKELSFSNYKQAWTGSNFAGYILNTVLITAGATALFFLMLTTTSYILGKYVFRAKKFFSGFYFVAMMIPSILVLVPLFFQLESLGGHINSLIEMITGTNPGISMTDNRAMLTVIYAVQAIPVPIFLVTGFVRRIDQSFLEAAYIDGAGEWYVFSRIILPFIRPIVLFQCLAVFMATWNEYTLATTFLGYTEAHHTLSVGLQHITEIFSRGQDFGTIFAALTLSMLPILVLYTVFHKQFLRGTDAGEGLK